MRRTFLASCRPRLDLPFPDALSHVEEITMAENLEELDQHIRACIAIFVALICLTAITVAVSYLNLPIPATISLALCIALIKGSMVVSYFMHLVSEKKLIFWSLSLTGVFFIILMVLPVVTDLDIISHTITVNH